MYGIAARGGSYEFTRLQRAAVHHKQIMEGTKMAATEMTKGKVIKILMYYRNIDNEIKINKCIADDLEEQYSSLGALPIDGMPKAQNNISRVTENIALNLPDGLSAEIASYREKISELHRLKAEILKEVSCLEFKQKSIVIDFYLYGLKWEQVAVRNHYSERQCKNIRNTALKSLAPKFSGNSVIVNYQLTA
jgi:hypothetical protein